MPMRWALAALAPLLAALAPLVVLLALAVVLALVAACPLPQGVPADSVGTALKAALDILKADASSEGAPGSADDQFNAGSSSPAPMCHRIPRGLWAIGDGHF
jgi:hypothetical protein